MIQEAFVFNKKTFDIVTIEQSEINSLDSKLAQKLLVIPIVFAQSNSTDNVVKTLHDFSFENVIVCLTNAPKCSINTESYTDA